MNTKQEQLKEAVEKTKTVGDFLGYRCEGRTQSIFAGHRRFFPGLILYSPGCYTYSHSLDSIARSFPEMQEPLGKVFTEASSVGACRFWKEKKLNLPKECDQASEMLKKAEEECYRALNN